MLILMPLFSLSVQFLFVQKLEAQKKDMACCIAELEKELALSTYSQKEKVAENVEYIRVWRQMKQLNDKLIIAQEKNTALTTEINELKTILEQTTKYIHDLSFIFKACNMHITYFFLIEINYIFFII
jgi:predicted  nucleic acid-binding Zn-ribbon protein